MSFKPAWKRVCPSDPLCSGLSCMSFLYLRLSCSNDVVMLSLAWSTPIPGWAGQAGAADPAGGEVYVPLQQQEFVLLLGCFLSCPSSLHPISPTDEHGADASHWRERNGRNLHPYTANPEETAQGMGEQETRPSLQLPPQDSSHLTWDP